MTFDEFNQKTIREAKFLSDNNIKELALDLADISQDLAETIKGLIAILNLDEGTPGLDDTSKKELMHSFTQDITILKKRYFTYIVSKSAEVFKIKDIVKGDIVMNDNQVIDPDDGIDDDIDGGELV